MGSGQQDLQAHMRNMSPRDWMVVGGGIAAFIFSLFPFVGASFGPFNFSINAWHSYAFLGILLIFVAAGAWVVRILAAAKVPELPLPFARAVAVVAGVGTLLVLIRGLTYSGESYANRSLGVSFRIGGILLLIAGAVVTVGAVLVDRATPATTGKRTSGSPTPGWTPPPTAPPAAPPASPPPTGGWTAPPAPPAAEPEPPAAPPAPPQPGSPPA